MFSRASSELWAGWRRSSGLSTWNFGTVCRELQPGSSSLLHSCEVAEHVEKIEDRERRRLTYGLEAGFGYGKVSQSRGCLLQNRCFKRRSGPFRWFL